MKYQFPEILTIQDVLPALESREEFIVKEKDDYIVINYNVALSDTFAMSDPLDRTGALRRECRGLIFSSNGDILSRPFHKFFNVGEIPETMPETLPLDTEHTRMEKMDGSMIRPFISQGQLVFGTKMGVTDVSEQAWRWYESNRDLYENTVDFLYRRAKLGYTDLFEWISPENRIVLAYDEPDLVYLGTRLNIFGNYVFEDMPFTQVERHGRITDDISSFLASSRRLENREGDVIAFSSGHRVKIKNDWYVRIHKAMDDINSERKVIANILDGNIDDLLSLLPEDTASAIRAYDKHFTKTVRDATLYLETIREKSAEYETRKEVATQLASSLHPITRASLFRMLDGASPQECIFDAVKRNMSRAAKWEDLKGWLGLESLTEYHRPVGIE